MGKGKQGESGIAGGALPLGVWEKVEVRSDGGSGHGSFALLAKRRDGSGQVEAVRDAAQLQSFHRNLVSYQVDKCGKSAQEAAAGLRAPFPEATAADGGAGSAPLGFLGLAGRVVAAAALVSGVAGGYLLHGAQGGAQEDNDAVESLVFVCVASGALLVLSLVSLACGALGGQRVASAAAVEQYLSRALQVEGGDKVLSALMEKEMRPDWPTRLGEIDLGTHDLAHASSQTEWWYYNTHLTAADDGRQLSAFISFFRVLKHVDARGKRYYSHCLVWAVSDVANERYYSDVLLESDSPSIMLKSLEKGDQVKDPIMRRAFKEVLDKGNVPLPDRLFVRDPEVPTDKLELDYEGATLSKNADGSYAVRATHHDLPCSLDLVFTPRKRAVRHGDDGVVKGKDGDDMFYYCIPRCSVSGTVTVPKPHKKGGHSGGAGAEGDVLAVAGDGWYDHEFGGKPESQWTYGKPEAEAGAAEAEASKTAGVRYAWNWVAAQLDDGTEVTAAMLMNAALDDVMEIKAILVDEHGERQQFDGEADGVTFSPLAGPEHVWGSVRTFVDYPTAFRLVVPGQLDLTVTATFGDQEFMTMIAKPAFWEGRCDVAGTKKGVPVGGLAFVERNGFNTDDSIKSFFKAVGKKVRGSVQAMYPMVPTFEEGVELIATQETRHYMKGVPLEVLGETLIAPVRLIADRGGKSWRSYGALACVDCVGGDSRDFVDWLAMPEFLHVGSLIVDDIQDKSETRRGGPAAHHRFGEPLCINAGTAAYFQCEQMLKVPGLSAEDLNKCYGLYFAALRGGHAGQALDIHGLDYMIDDVVASGDAALMEERILAIHMLKTAVPAGTLARMGALVGKGSPEQVEAMGLYFEGIGIAFQIMDDVLNLRGLYSKESDKLKVGTELKQLGEDISCGKVTMPVCKAMATLPTAPEREALWRSIQAKPHDKDTVYAIIQQLEDLGAVDQCVQQAEQVVTDAWNRLDQVIPDSFAKMMLRSFGWFVIERSQ